MEFAQITQELLNANKPLHGKQKITTITEITTYKIKKIFSFSATKLIKSKNWL